MDRVRFAVIGAGNIGKFHVRAMQEIQQAHVTVVCNRHGTEGQDLAEKANADWVSDYHDVVLRDDVDAVSICTPSGTHKEIAIAAAQAGKHVLVEKPIDITLPRIDAMLLAAYEANVKLSCIFQSRLRVGAQAVKQALDEGRFGKLLFANAFVLWHRSAEYYENNWRGTFELDGGGALMNQSIHSIDLLQWLAGPVKHLVAYSATQVHNIDAEDSASALLKFANGAQGIIQGATSLSYGNPARVEIHGSKGSAILEAARLKLWKLEDSSPEEEERMLRLEQIDSSGAQHPTEKVTHDAHREQIIDFIQAIINDRAPAIPGDEARKSVEIVRAIYQSAQDGQTISLTN